MKSLISATVQERLALQNSGCDLVTDPAENARQIRIAPSIGCLANANEVICRGCERMDTQNPICHLGSVTIKANA